MDFNKFKSTKQEIKKMKDLLRGQVKVIFEEGVRELFNDENLKEIKWSQYTPYFNDGDVCIFGVHEIFINGRGEYGEEWYEDAFEEEYIPFYTQPGRTQAGKEWDVIAEPVFDFMDLFDEEDLRYLFGDHVVITITKEGIKTEHYAHD